MGHISALLINLRHIVDSGVAYICMTIGPATWGLMAEQPLVNGTETTLSRLNIESSGQARAIIARISLKREIATS